MAQTLHHKLYHKSLALFTDFYQLTMAYGYWKTGFHEKQSVFHFTFRRHPFKGGFAVFAGLGTFMDFLQDFRFSDCDLDYLHTLKNGDHFPLFEEGFLDYLRNMEFSCDIDSVPEGTVVFPYEPLVRVKGPLIQAQILESALLNIINFQTLIATKAARIKQAAGSNMLVEFGMRRAQGLDGAISASRASIIGGSDATSNVLAGKIFSIPIKGTMSHSWVMAFEKELTAFQEFAKILPNHAVFLVDTYNSISGVEKAIEATLALKKEGFSLLAVRLDSGDLAKLSIKIRKLLDAAGLYSTKIMASNELDEHLIGSLKEKGAKITLWGVGTNLVTGKDQTAFDGVYKLSCLQDKEGNWIDKIKLSEEREKTTIPGILQVKRAFFKGKYLYDIVYDEKIGLNNLEEIYHPVTKEKKNVEEVHELKDLMMPIFAKGKKVYSSPSISSIKEVVKRELLHLDSPVKKLVSSTPYFVGLEKSLFQKRQKLIQEGTF